MIDYIAIRRNHLGKGRNCKVESLAAQQTSHCRSCSNEKARENEGKKGRD